MIKYHTGVPYKSLSEGLPRVRFYRVCRVGNGGAYRVIFSARRQGTLWGLMLVAMGALGLPGFAEWTPPGSVPLPGGFTPSPSVLPGTPGTATSVLKRTLWVLQGVDVRDGELFFSFAGGPDGRGSVRQSVSQMLEVGRGIRLQEPDRFVLDLKNVTLGAKGLSVPMSAPAPRVQSLRVGQFDPTTVRLVFDLQPNTRLNVETVAAGSPNVLGFRLKSSPLTVNPNGMTGVGSGFPSGASPELPVTPAASVDFQTLLASPLNHARTVSKVQVAATGALGYKVTPAKTNGTTPQDLLIVDLLNMRPPAGGAPQYYQVSHLEQLEEARLEAHPLSPKGSRLVLRYRLPVKGYKVNLDEHGRRLTLRVEHDNRANTTKPAPVVIAPPGESSNGKPAETVQGRFHVVVDAGHGGKDTGAIRADVREKDLNLAAALRLKAALEARGIRVSLTRSTDVFLPLPEITGITNRLQPDAFVSLHQNSHVKDTMRGIETYFYTPQSRPMADIIHRRIVGNVGRYSRDNGVRRAMFYVIHHTPVPAILCEMGYLSNPQERGVLTQPSYQQQFVEAVADGVVEFLNARTTTK